MTGKTTKNITGTQKDTKVLFPPCKLVQFSSFHTGDVFPLQKTSVTCAATGYVVVQRALYQKYFGENAAGKTTPDLLPSGWRYRSICCRTDRLRSRSFLQALHHEEFCLCDTYGLSSARSREIHMYIFGVYVFMTSIWLSCVASSATVIGDLQSYILSLSCIFHLRFKRVLLSSPYCILYLAGKTKPPVCRYPKGLSVSRHISDANKALSSAWHTQTQIHRKL